MREPLRVGTLWIGGRLSWLEQLCLASFTDHGHAVTLYTYEGVDNAPPGVALADAAAVFPADRFLLHNRTGSPAVHADAFRYRMIARTGLTWIDADILCLRPWAFGAGPVFGWERPGRQVCNAVLGLPADSPALARLVAMIADEYPIPPWLPPADRAALAAARDRGAPVHVVDLPWGVWGPAALTHILRATGEIAAAQPQQAFYPVAFRDRRDLLAPGRDLADRIGADSYGVHLWNRRLSRRLITHHGGVPPEGSYLAAALRRHRIDPAAAPIPDRPPGRSSAAAGPEAAASARAGATAATPAPDGLATRRIQRRPPDVLARLPLRRPAPGAGADRAEALERRLDRTGAWLTPPCGGGAERPRILAVTTMKNEAPFILEWIAHNRVIGIGHALVYTNDCADPTVPMLDRLAELGHVTRRDNPRDPAGPVKPQHAALRDAMRQRVVRKADWIAVIDVDEFPAIHVGDGTLADLLRATHHPDVLSLTWRFFGNGGIARYEDRPVIEQFTRCAPLAMDNPGMAWGFKTLFRRAGARFRKLGVHRPLKLAPGAKDDVRWVNGSGRVMPARLVQRGWRSVVPIYGTRLACLNHYALRSAESYLVKRDRGRVNHTAEDQGLYYWQRRNYIAETDTRITHVLPRVEEELQRLKADPVLADLHARAVAWHRARIARLKAEPDYARLFADLQRTAETDAGDFLEDIRPQDEPALQRVERPPAPVPQDGGAAAGYSLGPSAATSSNRST